jgi:hypothetical protein
VTLKKDDAKHPGHGNLTAADHDRIHDLHSRGFGLRSICRLIHRHTSTVQWYMYVSGIKAPKPRTRPMTYMRGTVHVHRFTQAEDQLIESLRMDGLTLEQIAARASAQFGTDRKHHSIRCRLRMLAATEVVDDG